MLSATDERPLSADERRLPGFWRLSIIDVVSPHPSTCPLRRRRIRGFTIIELMIALVIVGVLLSLAFPSLMGSIRKSRRAEAFTKLNAVQLAQERFRANSPTYAGNLTNDNAGSPPGLGLPATTADGRYAIAVDGAASDAAYAVSATPVVGSSQVDDGNCAQLRVRVVQGNIHYDAAPSGGSFDEALGRICWAR